MSYSADVTACINITGSALADTVHPSNYLDTILSAIDKEIGSAEYSWYVTNTGDQDSEQDAAPYILTIDPQFVESFDMQRLVDELLVIGSFGLVGEVHILDEYGDRYLVGLCIDGSGKPFVEVYTGRVVYDGPPEVHRK